MFFNPFPIDFLMSASRLKETRAIVERWKDRIDNDLGDVVDPVNILDITDESVNVSIAGDGSVKFQLAPSGGPESNTSTGLGDLSSTVTVVKVTFTPDSDDDTCGEENLSFRTVCTIEATMPTSPQENSGDAEVEISMWALEKVLSRFRETFLALFREGGDMATDASGTIDDAEHSYVYEFSEEEGNVVEVEDSTSPEHLTCATTATSSSFADHFSSSVDAAWLAEHEMKKRWDAKEKQIRELVDFKVRSKNGKALVPGRASGSASGSGKGNESALFSASASYKCLVNDLAALIRSSGELGYECEAVDDDVYAWRVRLLPKCFSSDSPLYTDLTQLDDRYGYAFVEIHLRFQRDLHPYFPPIVSIVRPRFDGFVMGQLTALRALQLTHWDPLMGARKLLREVQTLCTLLLYNNP
jgi:hypothetical protein